MLNRQTARLLIFALVVVLGVTAGVAQRKSAQGGKSDFLTEWTRMLGYPFFTASQGVIGAVDATITAFRLNSALKSENKRISEALKGIQSEHNELVEKAAEAERLTELLKLKDTVATDTVATRVLVRPATPQAETCIIDVGLGDGVRPGAAVLTSSGLVGQVLEVANKTSVVILLRDRRNSVAVLTQRARVPGICRGQGADELLMEYIPLNADIKPGDVIVSSGDGGVFPKGIPVGTIERIEVDDHSHFQTALVRPAVVFRSVEEALVVLAR